MRRPVDIIIQENVPTKGSMKTIEDITLTKTKPDEKKIEKAQELPIYFEQIKGLSKEDKDRIITEMLEELKAIREERDDKRLPEKWDALDNQYEGKVTEDARRMFNLSRQVTRVKVNKVDNLIMQALMKPDPKYSISPRPGFQKQGGQEICDKQSDFLDQRLDYLPFREPEGQTVHSAVLKGTGFNKISHFIKREPRRREEEYEGTPGKGKQPIVIGMQENGQPIAMLNDGLAEFLRNWPDAIKEYPLYVKQLIEGKKIRFVAQFKETTYNDPKFDNVNLKNFYARLSCDGYEGLKTTKLTAEEIEYSWWDLQREEKRNFFYDIDDLVCKDKDKKIKNEKYENKMYKILECNYYAKLKESDEEEIKCKFWISEEKKVMIGALLWPYYGIDCDYIPHYISKKNRGLYGESLGEVLTDSHAAENSLLNNILETAWMRSLITPIVEKGSSIHKQFISKSWTHGVPLVLDKNDKAPDFLQKYMAQADIPGMVTLIQYLTQGDDEATGVTSGMSGQESPVDPNAPAAKTIALLKWAGIDIDEYILTIAPSFNCMGECILQIYYQITQDGVEYAVKPDRVVGDNPFETLTRAEMIAKTNIQVMATSFDFDKINENAKDLALYQTFRADPIIARYPEAIYTMAKQVIKSWSPKWKNLIDRLLPPPAQFKKEQLQVAVQALALYIKQMVTEAKMTGAQPQIDPKQLLAVMAMAQKEAITPPTKDEINARKENAESIPQSV